MLINRKLFDRSEKLLKLETTDEGNNIPIDCSNMWSNVAPSVTGKVR